MTARLVPRLQPRSVTLSLCALLLAGFAAYQNSFEGAFLFDDRSSILENVHIRSFWPVWHTVIAEPESVVAGRPAVALSFAFNYALGGLRVWGYHAVNLALHLLSGLLVFGIARRTLIRARPRRGPEADGDGTALAIALLWLVHPLLTESVMYVTQRTELLMGGCYLATLYASIRALEARRPRRWEAAAIAACAVGMASKEVMVSAPLAVFLYDGLFVFRSWRQALQARRRLYLGLALTWAILVALVLPGPRSQSAGFHLPQITPWRYALTQSGVIVHYLRLAVWPHPLVLDYHDWPIAQRIVDVWPSLAAVLALLAATIVAIARRWRIGFLGAWFFLILAPSSSVLPIVTEVAAERRMYLPLIAVVALLVLGGRELLRRAPVSSATRRGAAAGLVILLALAGTALTVRRNADYHTEDRIWGNTVAVRPDNARAHNNLGSALWRQGKAEEAAQHFERALELKPIYADAYSNLGNVRLRAGRIEEAVGLYRKALQLKPASASAHNNLGNAEYRLKRYDEAMQHYREALRLKPHLIEPYNNLGNVLLMQGKLEEAAESFEEALRRNPSYAEAHNGLGVTRRQQGRWDEAIRHFEAALSSKPSHALAKRNLEEALARKRRHDKGREQGAALTRAPQLRHT